MPYIGQAGQKIAQVYAGQMGPAFRAVVGTGGSLAAAAWTKVAFGSEEFDTASCYDTSLSRFTPNVAGYYQVNGSVSITANVYYLYIAVYKNGSEYAKGTRRAVQTAYGDSYQAAVHSLIYLNGSTDYIEIYALSAGARTTHADAGNSEFSAALVRTA